MSALEGNTAAHLQYAHARICSIFRRAQQPPPTASATFSVGHAVERELVLQLADFGPSVLASVEPTAPALRRPLRARTGCSAGSTKDAPF